VLSPESFQKFAGWWVRLAVRMPLLMGGLCGLLGLAIWVVLLLSQPLVNWVLGLFGAAFLAGAFLYMNTQALQKGADACILKRGPMALRASFALGIVVSVLVLWVALRG
jgi:hypothetical protein